MGLRIARTDEDGCRLRGLGPIGVSQIGPWKPFWRGAPQQCCTAFYPCMPAYTYTHNCLHRCLRLGTVATSLHLLPAVFICVDERNLWDLTF